MASYFPKWVERNGLTMRGYLGITPYIVLNPRELARVMNVTVMSLKEVPNLPKEVLFQLLENDPSSWSAGCLPISQRAAVILYNPTHAVNRINATIMEELAHLHLKHSGSKLITERGQNGFRSYKKSEETQAYSVGAAALIPAALLKKAKGRGISKDRLACEHGVSIELLRFRENVTGIRLN